MHPLRKIFFASTIILATFVATFFLVLLWVLRLNRKFGGWVARAWARILVSISGITIETHGLELVDRTGNFIFVSNHLSHFDTLAVTLTLPPSRLRYLGKRQLFSIPFFGWCLSLIGYIPVDPPLPGQESQVLLHAEEAVAQGCSLIFFAEGTRSRNGRLHPFRPGALRLARRTSTPVIPVGIRGTPQILPRGELFPRRGTIVISYGRPFSSSELEGDFGSIQEQIRTRVAELSGQDLAPLPPGSAAPLHSPSPSRKYPLRE